jgi:O-antigen/teichoic acid export membrane protein
MRLRSRFVLFLLPSIYRTLIGFLIIPLTTFKLEPADFGLFAFIVAIAGVAIGASSLGSSQILSAHLPIVTREDAKELVTSIFIFSHLAAAIFAVVLFLVWPIILQNISEIESAPNSLGWILPLAIFLATPWGLAAAVATVTGRATGSAIITILESSTASGATLAALYAFDQGALSLYIGMVAGAVVGAAGSLVYLRQFLCFRIRRKWIIETIRVTIISFAGNLTERVQVFLERYALSEYVGLSALGFYSHAQQYQGIARMGMKAWLTALWPIALEDARQSQPTFHRFLSVFPASQFFLGLAGIAMATLGKDFIGFLTHGKFTSSYLVASFLIVNVQIEYMARPSLALLSAQARYLDLQKSLAISLSVAILIVIPMIRLFGIYGALATASTQCVVYRLLLARAASKLTDIVFSDKVGFFGVLATLTSVFLASYCTDALSARLAIWILVTFFLITFFVISRRPN